VPRFGALLGLSAVWFKGSLTEPPAHNFYDAFGNDCGIIVCPGTDHEPACLCQLPIRIGVSDLVGNDFVAPPRCVLFGPGAVLRTPMPEAAIDKDGHSGRGKNNVRPPAKTREGIMINSVAQARSVQDGAQCYLARSIPSPRDLHSTQHRCG
jgi:hypothetical protein